MATFENQRKELTPVQKRFCKEYPIDFNGAAAYMRASGTSNRKSAGVQASKLLKIPKVTEYIEAYVQEQLGPLEKDLLGNVKFWIEIRDNQSPGMGKGSLVALKDVIEVLKSENIEIPEALSRLSSYDIPYSRPADRLKASEMLAKYRSMFVEKKEIKADFAVQIIDDIK